MEHVKWAIKAVHENVREAHEKILKAYRLREECKPLADWERDMAMAHIDFNNGGTRLAMDHIQRAREEHAHNERALGKIDAWEHWLHDIVGQMAEVRAIIDSYK